MARRVGAEVGERVLEAGEKARIRLQEGRRPGCPVEETGPRAVVVPEAGQMNRELREAGSVPSFGSLSDLPSTESGPQLCPFWPARPLQS